MLDAYLGGSLVATLTQPADEEITDKLPELPPEEAAVLMLLEQQSLACQMREMV